MNCIMASLMELSLILNEPLHAQHPAPSRFYRSSVNRSPYPPNRRLWATWFFLFPSAFSFFTVERGRGLGIDPPKKIGKQHDASAKGYSVLARSFEVVESVGTFPCSKLAGSTPRTSGLALRQPRQFVLNRSNLAETWNQFRKNCILKPSACRLRTKQPAVVHTIVTLI